MAVKEKLPSFTENEYQAFKMRQLIMILERRLASLELEIANSVAASGIPAGGDADEVLTKVTGADYDVDWLPASGGGVTMAEVAARVIGSL